MNDSVAARIFCSRKVWIAIAAVAGCVVTVLGADPAKWTPLISAIVTLASVVIAAIGYEDGQEKGAPLNTIEQTVKPESPANPTGGNVSLNALGWLLVPAVMLTALGGCASDVRTRWSQARDGLSVAQDALVREHAAGTLSDHDLVALDPFVQSARGALALADTMITDAGDPPSGDALAKIDFYLDLAERVLTRLTSKDLEQLEAANGDRGNPGTHLDRAAADRAGRAAGPAREPAGSDH